jgi:hypothetical protein
MVAEYIHVGHKRISIEYIGGGLQLLQASRDRKRRMAARWRPYALINRISYLH